MQLVMRNIRKKKGYTQEQLAEIVGATKRQIGAWERGENDMPMDYAVAIADALGCSIDQIAGRTEYAFVTMNRNDTGYTVELKPFTEADELLRLYRSMTDEGRQQLMIFARGLAATYPKSEMDCA